MVVLSFQHSARSANNLKAWKATRAMSSRGDGVAIYLRSEKDKHFGKGKENLRGNNGIIYYSI